MQETNGKNDTINMLMILRLSFVCVLLVLGSSCAPQHEPVSKEDQQIIAVMMVIGAGIGAGVGAASASGANSTGVAVAVHWPERLPAMPLATWPWSM